MSEFSGLFLFFKVKISYRNRSLEKHVRGWSIISFLIAVQAHHLRDGNLVINNFNNVLKIIYFDKQPRG